MLALVFFNQSSDRSALKPWINKCIYWGLPLIAEKKTTVKLSRANERPEYCRIGQILLWSKSGYISINGTKLHLWGKPHFNANSIMLNNLILNQQNYEWSSHVSLETWKKKKKSGQTCGVRFYLCLQCVCIDAAEDEPQRWDVDGQVRLLRPKSFYLSPTRLGATEGEIK